MQVAVTGNNREDHPQMGVIREGLSEWQTSKWRPKGGGRTSYGRANISSFGNSKCGGTRVGKMLVCSRNQRGPLSDAGKVRTNLTLSGLGAGLC